MRNTSQTLKAFVTGREVVYFDEGAGEAVVCLPLPFVRLLVARMIEVLSV